MTADDNGAREAARLRTVASIWEHYASIKLAIGEQGGGDRTLNDIAFLVAEIERLRVALEHVDRLLTRVMDESNLHIFEPVATTVTAALTRAADEGDHMMLSTRQVAEMLGLQPDTIRAYVSRGLFPQPDGWLDHSPWWYRGTAEVWQATQRRPMGRPKKARDNGR